MGAGGYDAVLDVAGGTEGGGMTGDVVEEEATWGADVIFEGLGLEVVVVPPITGAVGAL